MPRDLTLPTSTRSIALVSRDATLLADLRDNAQRAGFDLCVHGATIDELSGTQWVGGSAIVLIDIETSRREQISALQRLCLSADAQVPIIVLTDVFDANLARLLLQLRVRDFLTKPLHAGDVLRSCETALASRLPGTVAHTDVLTFVPAAGGVGNTTIAVEAAMQLSEGGRHSVCLVDLDLHNNACADFLDLEPRLDLAELGPQGERLDVQLLEVMLSAHQSGVSLLAAPARPGEACELQAHVVSRILDVCAQRCDRLVIDLPRAGAPWTDDVLAGSDRIFIVTDMTVPGLRCARRLAARVEERLGPSTSPRIIVNRFQVGTLFGSGLRKTDVERALGSSFAGPVANNYPLVREAIDRGVPLSAVKSGNRVSADLNRILFSK